MRERNSWGIANGRPLSMASVDSGRPDSGDLGTWPAAQQRGCLTVVAAATWLGISRAKLYELLAAGEVRSFTIGRSRRVPVDELTDFVRRRLEAEAPDRPDASESLVHPTDRRATVPW